MLSELASSDYLFYDTYWYYHIGNLREIGTYFGSSQEEVKHQLKIALEEVYESLKNGKLMTGNKFLIGKIFSRGTKEFTSIIEKLPETITAIFGDLCPLLIKIENLSF